MWLDQTWTRVERGTKMQHWREATDTFARLVEGEKLVLMNRDPKLTALDAHRLAMQAITKEKPELVKSYRLDAQR